MNPLPLDGPALRRLVVALGGRARDEAALALAARLARRMDAELSALFLEDSELLDACSLPVTALLSARTPERRALDLVSVERGYRVEARRLRRLVATVSERHFVRWSFSVRRTGDAELARPLGRDELLVIMPQGRAERRRRLAEALSNKSASATLILEYARWRAHRHVAALHEGDEAVPAAAARLAGALEAALSVIPVRGAKGAPHTDEERLRQWSGGLAASVSVTEAARGDFEALRDLLERLDPDVVTIGRGGPVLSGLGFDALDGLLGPRAVLVAGEGA